MVKFAVLKWILLCFSVLYFPPLWPLMLMLICADPKERLFRKSKVV
jgi:hypothetical protein